MIAKLFQFFDDLMLYFPYLKAERKHERNSFQLDLLASSIRRATLDLQYKLK